MGRVTKDITASSVGEGCVADFVLAVEREVTKNTPRNDQGYPDPGTDFIYVKCWNQTAKWLEKNAGQGSVLVVEGRIRVDSWTDQQGQNKRNVYVLASRVYPPTRKELVSPQNGGGQDGYQGGCGGQNNGYPPAQQNGGYGNQGQGGGYNPPQNQNAGYNNGYNNGQGGGYAPPPQNNQNAQNQNSGYNGGYNGQGGGYAPPAQNNPPQNQNTGYNNGYNGQGGGYTPPPQNNQNAQNQNEAYSQGGNADFTALPDDDLPF